MSEEMDILGFDPSQLSVFATNTEKSTPCIIETTQEIKAAAKVIIIGIGFVFICASMELFYIIFNGLPTALM